MAQPDHPRRWRVLVAWAGPDGPERLMDVRRRLHGLDVQYAELVSQTQEDEAFDFRPTVGEPFDFSETFWHAYRSQDKEYWQHVELMSEWPDIFVLFIGVDRLAKMLQGISDDVILRVIRVWDISKRILLVPHMSKRAWDNPMTKRHLGKLRRNWTWVRTLDPVLWQPDELEPFSPPALTWHGADELVAAVKNEVDLMNFARHVNRGANGNHVPHGQSKRLSPRLPPELWSLIFDHTGDWEIARALGIHTTLPWPSAWAHHHPESEHTVDPVMKELEWAILTGTCADVARILEAGPAPKELGPLAVRVIIEFALTEILSYIEKTHGELFRNTFGHMRLPIKASTVFGRVEVLEWWRRSPSFPNKEHNGEAYGDIPMDGASKAGFVHVLDWWKKSGLPLRYSEAALEQASARGNIDVLEWWRHASMDGDDHPITPKSPKDAQSGTDPVNGANAPLKLKVGKSICYAAQHGQVEVIRWWDQSGIPYPHQDAVTRLASTHGHVNILDTWKELKGEKMIYDNQVLVGPTRNGHWRVLQWWKNSGFVVEYRPSDIEEALEDSLGAAGEQEVRVWWAHNGSTLGIGTSEWMQPKVL